MQNQGVDLLPTNQQKKPLNPKEDKILIPAIKLLGYRMRLAMERGTIKNLIMNVWGGLGDQICAEPTLRYAVETLKDVDISLCAMNAELFSHLKFKNVYDFAKGEKPNLEEFHFFNTMCMHNDLPWEFICQIYTHCVDAASLYAFRCQLPLKYKSIELHPKQECFDKFFHMELSRSPIVLHPGKHWKTKTFPKWFWDRVIAHIKKYNFIPVIIGGHNESMTAIEMTRTTVDVDTEGCIDLRCKLSLMESVALLKQSAVLLTNDSVPLHMGAATNCWIGFITLAKHPDYITHYRHGQFGWRMKSFQKSGMWDKEDILTGVSITDWNTKELISWLPEPEEFAQWAIDRVKEVYIGK